MQPVRKTVYHSGFPDIQLPTVEFSLNAVITTVIRLRYDYDPTTTYRARLLPFDAIQREQKMNVSIFFIVVVS